ncbi:AVT5 (YBL089W) and AVT6 (YER119C) [Zygosaccharomyces parabailii]|nr:AVT5 (YBL089W) and AVT6 (YER119C) [Zygosaccharomyces parabailii]CDH14270.1 related to Vacuolar amino acid transporter 6 [Zygosaccharomyces bailii ISA1307]
MSSNVKSGVATLLHTACGAGILAMPYGFKPLGLTFGIVALAFCSICAMAGLLLQAQVARYVPDRSASFFRLTQLIHPKLSVVFDLAIAVKCFGVGVSYMIVVGDLLPQVFATFTSHKFLLDRNFHITMVMLFIVSPLCFMKKLTSLKKASVIALSSVGYLCCLVVIHFFWPSQEIHDRKGKVSFGFPKNEPTPLTTLPIFVFAFTCHHNAFSVYNEQKDISTRKLTKIGRYAMAIAFVLYTTIGGAGYLTFGDKVAGNIITLYPPSLSTTVGRVAIALLVMLAFPLQCHPARTSISDILYFVQAYAKQDAAGVTGGNASENTENSTLLAAEESLEDEERNPPVSTLHGKKFNIITICILVASYLLAISVTSLARILAVVGSTGSTSISFILPGIFGYYLIGSEYPPDARPKKAKVASYAGLVLALWGLIVMVASLVATLLIGASH